MNTTFIISGGAGRVVTSIPALEKFHRLNPKDDFKVLVHGWIDLFWSHPLLQGRTFEINQKGVFEQHIKDNNTIVPEPYHLRSFYNQEKNMIQAFDEIINKTEDHSDLTLPNLYVSTTESLLTEEIFNDIRGDSNKKIVVFQPFGSGCKLLNNKLHDNTHRSLTLDNYLSISNALKDKCNIIYASSPEFKPDDGNASISQWNPYLRVLTSFILKCDYFIGCDSVGQHIARAHNKPGTIIMGSTNEKNFSYPDHFKIVRKKDREPIYNPYRLVEAEIDFIDRMNEGINSFSDEGVQKIIQIIQEDL